MQHLPLNITYATWAGLGLVLTTVVSIIIFKEQINLITIHTSPDIKLTFHAIKNKALSNTIKLKGSVAK